MKYPLKLFKTAGVVVIAVMLMLFGASAAFAASSYNVTAGSATSADSPIGWGAQTTGGTPQVTFTDTTHPTTLNCASATASGTINVGSNLAGQGLGTIAGPGTGWNGCTGPNGLSLTVTGSQTWSLNATGDTANDQTDGTITNVHAHVQDSIFGLCQFDVTGHVEGYYDNGSTELVLPGQTSTLTISNVTSGCSSFVPIADGDVATFKATYVVGADNASFNPINITSNP